MANLLDMQKILGGIQQQYPVTPPTPTPTANPTTGKNETLAMMLYALGGALKGDEDFVVKTLQFKEMQEGKKKEKEQKEAWEKVKQSALIQSNPNIATLANALTPEQGISLAVEMETREPKKKSVGDFKAEILAKIQRGETLTSTDYQVLDVIQRTDPIDVAVRSSLGETGLGMDTTIEDTPQNFQGTSEQWAQLKASNPDRSDQELIDWYTKNYGN
jgi:hypothetical protein